MANRSCQISTITSPWLLWVIHTDKELLALSKGKIKAEGGNTAELEGFGNFSHQRIPDSRDPTPDHQNPEPESPRGGTEIPPCQELPEAPVAQPPLEEVRVPQREEVQRFPKLRETNYSLNHHK